MAATLPSCFVRNQHREIARRIAHARGVILERIEDGYKKPPTSEQISLLETLSTLDSLRRITERQNGYQSKAD